MKILSIYDKQFNEYGKVIEEYNCSELISEMGKIAMPEKGVNYEPSIADLEKCNIYSDFSDRGYGGMPIQIGMCWGYNTKLNCLEYHRDSEINLGISDFVLLLAKQTDINNNVLDTVNVKAFHVPANVPVEIYATTLHYAPCHIDAEKGFKVVVVLPKGTNMAKPVFEPKCTEDTWLTACNKWLLAHRDADEARNGAYVGLVGENIDISNEI